MLTDQQTELLTILVQVQQLPFGFDNNNNNNRDVLIRIFHAYFDWAFI